MLTLPRLNHKLSTRLAVLGTLGVVLALLALGLSFDVFLQSTFLDGTRVRMSHAYQRLASNLNSVEQKLQKTIASVAADERLQASVELVNHYQDKGNYNIFLIDEEKKTVAQTLLSHIKLSQSTQLAIYDQNHELIAYAHQQARTLWLGYVSYADGQARVWSRTEAEHDYQPGKLPQDGSIAMIHHDITAGELGPQAVASYQRVADALLLQQHLNLTDPGTRRRVLSIDLGQVLDAATFEALSKDMDMDLRLLFQHPLAAHAQQLDKRPDVAAVQVTDSGDSYVGLMKKDTLDGPVYFVSTLDKSKENAAVNTHRLRYAAWVVGMALAMLGFMRWVLVRRLAQPLGALMAQIQLVKQGDYHNLPTVSSGDELEAISRSVNRLAQTVQEREAALEKARQEEQYLSRHDLLTGLPNARFLHDRLDHAMDLAQRNHSQLALVFVDLDQFKMVNDTLGHPVGDLLLVKIAERFSHNVRATDTLARMGGDEFNVLIENVRAQAELELLVDKFLALFREPFECGDQRISITASMGVVRYPIDGLDSVTLVKNADLAVYAAKANGRNTRCFYSAELSRLALERADLIHALKVAIESDDQFELYYQGKVDAVTARVVSAEALIRWHRPGGALVSPALFIPVAEETRQIIPMGDWIVRQACRDLVKMQQAGLELRHLSINVSNIQLQSHNLQAVIEQALTQYGLSAHQLELEMTESYVAKDTSVAIGALHAFRHLGLALSIDDFGTGYSSLSYLKKLPFTRLKIDKSFVDGVPDDADSVAVVRAIVGLAHNFGLAITAEGVENARQLAFLRDLNCDEIQGYFYAKPLPLDAFVVFCRDNQAATASENL